ncbi:MAG: hypothetical protein ACKO1F_14255 [Flammeovirgaceae bacterium]
MSDSLITPGLYICYALFIIALLAAVLMPLLNAIKHPADLVKSLIGVVLLVALFGVSYALSGSEVTAKYTALGVNASSSKLIGAGMIMFYVTLIVAAILAIVSMVRDITGN